MKPEMRTVMTFVTPQMASAWLAKNNEGNRNVRQADVSLLASEIASGGYEPTHQGIGFYDDGTLADGQHRLHAIAKAGVGVWINVTTGLRRVANHKIDRGIGRTSRDSLHFEGIKADAKKVAVCTCMIYQFDTEVAGRSGWHTKKTPSEQYAEFYRRFSDAIEFAMSFPSASRMPAPVAAAVATAWFTQDRDRLGEFMRALDTGEIFSDRDRACLKIRDYVNRKMYGQGMTARHDLFLRCCSALRYFLAGKGLSKLYATQDSAFSFAEVA